MVGFDLETTAPLPEEARIVTASLAFVGGGEPTVTHDWLADPGVPIPDEAAEVHGITTEKAQAEGRPVREVVWEVVELLHEHARQGLAIVIFNARYDVTVSDRELRRYHGIELPPVIAEHVVDPTVIDKRLWRYRKSYPPGYDAESAALAGIPSSRTLAGMCRVYGAQLDQAHASDADAIAGARLAWAMGKKGRVISNPRSAEEKREVAAWIAEWEQVRHDLPALVEAQRRWALAERERFATYKADQGEHDEAERIRMERGWPLLEPMPHEELQEAA